MDIKVLKELGKFIEQSLIEIDIPQDVLNIFPEKLIKQYEMIPYKIEDSKLHIATANLNTSKSILNLKSIANMDVDIKFTTTLNIKEALAKFYKITNYQSSSIHIEDVVENEDKIDENNEIIEEEMTALGNRVKEMLDLAIESKATDIHIKPLNKKTEIIFKINAEEINFSDKVHSSLLQKKVNGVSQLVAKIKIMCTPSMATSRIMPQSGAFQHTWQGKKVDFRVSVIPTIRGESVVLRILKENKDIKNLDLVGYSPETVKKIRKVVRRPGGLCLVTGPVNSGKSTTLYACVDEYDLDRNKVIAIEDPVEQKNEKIIQVQVKAAEMESVNLTFAKVLRETLRHDPKTLLVGEIRDKETAEIALEASLTGHKVFSTLHATNVITSITRLLNIGIPKHLLLDQLQCIVNQRLISTLCEHCSEEYVVTNEELEMLDDVAAKALKLKKIKRVSEEKSATCIHCNNTGYSGMVVIEECLILDAETRDFILNNNSLLQTAKFLKEKGFITIQERAIDLIKDGKTSIDKYLTTIPDNS